MNEGPAGAAAAAVATAAEAAEPVSDADDVIAADAGPRPWACPWAWP